MTHKSGFVNIIGHPNVGKSTLMNALVGEKLSIITSKAQTTRHRILGIVNDEQYQVIFSDTPGIIERPAYKMHELMNSFIQTALVDADLLMVVIDVTEKTDYTQTVEKIRSSKVPVFVLLNKSDLSTQELMVEHIRQWEAWLPQAEVVPISATLGFNIDGLLERIVDRLPVSPAYYPKDELTDRSMRFFVSEIIREKILIHYQQEIPYSVEVAVDSYEESAKLIKIRALIFVARESQKAILIGKQGLAIKKVGIQAREDIEQFTGKKIFLELSVKVVKDWRDNETVLKRFGYE
ncbi:MAG: GTPase Era [Bacteroidales bacterium]|jgi:GTP-binding protein Era|nr:GTPase Era [Bacteroidales bacterium]MDD3700542.1 GTPase Era [Bacteroidales bacterium]MDY0368334.1 GTPase Era [Bacteroidales bacterium]